MPPLLRFALAAVPAAIAGTLIAMPAAAQSSVGFSISVGNGGYYSPYYGYGGFYDRYSPFYDDFPYSRAARRACARDPFCASYRGVYPAYPAPIYAAPVVTYRSTYETRDTYDPLPRWRAIAPQAPGGYAYQDAYGYQQPYNVDLYQQPAGAQPYAPVTGPASGAPPVSPEGAVRYDLAQRGYVASDFADPGSFTAPQFQTYPETGAADSYIRGAGDPDDVLLGGPR